MWARRIRDAAMGRVEDARHAIVRLSPDDYSDQKAIYGNAQHDVERFQAYMRCYAGGLFGLLSTNWMWSQAEMKIRKPTLAQLWRLWRDVVATRNAYAAMWTLVPQPPRQRYEDDWGHDKFEVYVGTRRQRAEAQAAYDEACGRYDLHARAFDGRVPRTHAQTLEIHRYVKKPTQAAPTPASKIQNRLRRRMAGKRNAFDTPYERSPS